MAVKNRWGSSYTDTVALRMPSWLTEHATSQSDRSKDAKGRLCCVIVATDIAHVIATFIEAQMSFCTNLKKTWLQRRPRVAAAALRFYKEPATHLETTGDNLGSVASTSRLVHHQPPCTVLSNGKM
jgi:deoxycytidylate deaminase